MSRYGPLLIGRHQLSVTHWETEWQMYFCVDDGRAM